MALDQRRFERKHTDVLRDIRPMYVRLAVWLKKPANSAAMFFMGAFAVYKNEYAMNFADLLLLLYGFYFLWLIGADRSLAYKLPAGAKWKDSRNMGGGRKGVAEGILYLGNVKDTKEEVWFTNADARTHILYLGTTGSGKTEGLKSLVTNALTWGSGFIYVDGKADTDLWSSLSSLVRRFGRDDDLLVLNYMTGNAANMRAPSNTMNPFSSGSASYLTNMLVSLMPEAEGDNAMWKERAVALIASLMPALCWKRDNQDIPLSIGTIRSYLNLNNVIKLSRDPALPDQLRAGVKGYLDTLPGYVDAAFDDEGREKPAGPDQPMYDTTTPRQQHGYLSMQFTRALQSLGDEYGYIFDTQAADVDMIDVVLNRRILVVLIPALEKSADETANLGKIVAATLKGMMGSTLGATVEGESATVIENKPTHSSTPFMTVFDEVGYYTAQGMAVMAAQARSLGFSLVYSAQDLPALEKRVKEEARSITANCNIKIFGKLEDPTQTKEFFEKTVGSSIVVEATGFQLQGGRSVGSYYDNMQAAMQIRPRASYDGLKAFKEGEAVLAFGEMIFDTSVFYSNPGHAKAMRVTRYVALPPPDENMIRHANAISTVRDLMIHKTWTAQKADVRADTPPEIGAMADTLARARKAGLSDTEAGMAAVIGVLALHSPIEDAEEDKKSSAASSGGSAGPQPATPVSSAAQPQKPAIFSMQPKSQTPPPAAAAEPPSVPASIPPADESGAAVSGGPMSFFAKKKTDSSAAQQPPSWEDLAKQSPPQTPPEGEGAAPPFSPFSGMSPEDSKNMEEELQRMLSGLDPEARKILEEAGKQINSALTKGSQTETGQPGGKKKDGDDKNSAG